MTRALAPALVLLALACGRTAGPGSTPPPPRPSILLVTLDTTRADAIGPEARGVATPAFNDLCARGLRFRQAYATAPETLPSHASLMTGLHPAGHGIHENARALAGDRALLAERLKGAGYRTAAFVSAFVLARRFGLARGFDVYDDALPDGRVERSAAETTERALAELDAKAGGPRFLWVHYFDPHTPYEPPEPFRTRYAEDRYRGEVAAMDEQLGRLVQAFEARVPGPRAILAVSDHGEGRGDHGESQHGRLLYQSTMRVPLVIVGPGIEPGVSDPPVSARRVFHTVLDWAGLDPQLSLRMPDPEVVMGEAMKPFLAYGWQPQVMAIQGRHKAIQAGTTEVFDVLADPGETRDLSGQVELTRPLRTALKEYPTPSLAPARPSDGLAEEDRRKLASLGYVGAAATPVVRNDAPRPAAMVALFADLDEASTRFVRGEYARVVPLLQRILKSDPGNLDAALRLATAHSMLGRAEKAEAAFERARQMAPHSPDVRAYLALHLARGPHWERAVPLLEQVIAESPDRVPALEALGELAMRQGRTGLAIQSFDNARRLQGDAFRHFLELGVLYLAAGRHADAAAALDRVPPSHPGYPMALFKRAQASVLLGEPDRAARIDLARRRADATTRPLIERERLFREAP